MSRNVFRCQYLQRNGLPCKVMVKGTAKGLCYLHDTQKSSIVFVREYGKFKVGDSMKRIANDVASPYIEAGHAIYLADLYNRLGETIDGILRDVTYLIRQDDQVALIQFFRGKGSGRPSRQILLRLVNDRKFTADERGYLRGLLRRQGWLNR